jgi:hypothetical protein
MPHELPPGDPPAAIDAEAWAAHVAFRVHCARFRQAVRRLHQDLAQAQSALRNRPAPDSPEYAARQAQEWELWGRLEECRVEFADLSAQFEEIFTGALRFPH